MFDGLLFPLLALDAVIGGFWIFILKVVFMNHLMIPVCALLALATIVGIDFFIIRAVWRATNRPVAAPAPPVQKPDRFWRWFAVVVLAMIAIPILISIIGIFASIAIPVFVKARAKAQENALHAAAQLATNRPSRAQSFLRPSQWAGGDQPAVRGAVEPGRGGTRNHRRYAVDKRGLLAV